SATKTHAKGAYKLLRKRVFFMYFEPFLLTFSFSIALSLLSVSTALCSKNRLSLYKKDFLAFFGYVTFYV
ncbi:MAG: hypothetical protein K2L52_03775, partial [Clostridia bacterium]|nr:hypothetical protein [Clostridia bacterium]